MKRIKGYIIIIALWIFWFLLNTIYYILNVLGLYPINDGVILDVFMITKTILIAITILYLIVYTAVKIKNNK
ncbi:MAG: hypothetical protein PHD15_06240 [Clostridia bacterium]|nr:hypothetical protein [Clostridia bacterium]MDD4387329.1 hypothetical protein [Clostridia bacterium]